MLRRVYPPAPDAVVKNAVDNDEKAGNEFAISKTDDAAKDFREYASIEWFNFTAQLFKAAVWLFVGLMLFGVNGAAYTSQLALRWYQPGRSWSGPTCDVGNACTWTTVSTSWITTNGVAMMIVPYFLFPCIYVASAVAHYRAYEKLRNINDLAGTAPAGMNELRYLSTEKYHRRWMFASMHITVFVLDGLVLYNLEGMNSQYTGILLTAAAFGAYMGSFHLSRRKAEELKARSALDDAIRKRAMTFGRQYAAKMSTVSVDPSLSRPVQMYAALLNSLKAEAFATRSVFMDDDASAQSSVSALALGVMADAGLNGTVDIAFNAVPKFAMAMIGTMRGKMTSKQVRAEQDLSYVMSTFMLCSLVSAPIWIANGQAVNPQGAVTGMAIVYQIWILLVSFAFHAFAAFVMERDEYSYSPFVKWSKTHIRSRLESKENITGGQEDVRMPMTSYQAVSNLFSLWTVTEGMVMLVMHTAMSGLVRVHYVSPSSTGLFVSAN